MRAKGYAVIGRQAELAALGQLNAQPIGKLLGLFNRSQMGYDIDRATTGRARPARHDEPCDRPAPAQHDRVRSDRRSSRIGDALDASQARKALQEARAFDDTIAMALEKVRTLDPAFTTPPSSSRPITITRW